MGSNRHLIVFVLLAVLATACTKEDRVRPSDQAAHNVVPTKNTAGGGVGVAGTGNPPPQEGAVSGGTPDTNTGTVGISDDGDDISDSEKTRKKRR